MNCVEVTGDEHARRVRLKPVAHSSDGRGVVARCTKQPVGLGSRCDDACFGSDRFEPVHQSLARVVETWRMEATSWNIDEQLQVIKQLPVTACDVFADALFLS